MIGALLKPLLGPIVDKALDLIPNGNERARAKEQLETSLLSAVESAAKAQAETNTAEAKHKSIFVAGWRPFIGWVCGVSIAWSLMVQPMVIWALHLNGVDVSTMPVIDTDQIYQMLMGMLGLGGLRTFEKVKGVAREK